MQKKMQKKCKKYFRDGALMREALKKNIKKYREKEHVSPAGGGVVLVVHYFTTPRRADKKKERKSTYQLRGALSSS